MTTSAELAALADEVEKADGPSRELDADIHEAMGKCAHRETEYYCIEDGNDVDSGFTCMRCHEDMYGRRQDVRSYTASVDAILGLIGEVLSGWHGEVQFGRGAVQASLHSPWRKHQSERRHANGFAATPALALTAAFLRALVARTGDEA